MDKKLILLAEVRKYLTENPNDFPEFVKAATKGVEDFAQRQSDVSSKLAYRLAEVISENPDFKTKCFDKKDVLDHIEPWFYNTPWFKEQKGQLEIND